MDTWPRASLTVMRWGTPVLGFVVALAYDLLNGSSIGDTPGKSLLKLRVVARTTTSVTEGVPNRTGFLRALAWWTPVFLAQLAVTDFPLTRPLPATFGPVPCLDEVPYAGLLLLVPVVNGVWRLWDRRLRRLLTDRLANTVVVWVPAGLAAMGGHGQDSADVA